VGRGLLTAQITSLDNIGVDDPRRQLPRFSPENIKNNLRLTRALAKVAQRKGCTPAQLAINWVRSLSKRAGMPTIIPIPGTTKVERVKENAKIIDLTEDDMASIDTLLAEYPVVGDKYHKVGMELLDR
jgi:pyridoxine 4-dehydrogenase